MNDVRIQVARRIDVAKDNWKGLRWGQLFRADISRSEPVAVVALLRVWTHRERVRDLKVIAQSFAVHQLGALEWNRKDLCKENVGC